ncbi:MAG: phage terminase small subunit P27 family [Rhodobacteraceae bacterium]|nr:phage terminase small subunit P27 family [Paracoccaceae bacterium]
MARGRKPKPTALKLLTGNPGKRTLPNDEPQIPPHLPPVPEHLNKVAREEWARVSESLYNCGILTSLDRAALGAYCTSYSRWSEAEIKLEADGFTIETSLGTIIQSPLVGIANKAAADMVRYAAEFGMTPSARSRVKIAENAEDKPTAAARYLA